jgi:DNA-binding NarL/FixJ family response regulator
MPSNLPGWGLPMSKQVCKSLATLDSWISLCWRLVEVVSMKTLRLSSHQRRQLEMQLKHSRDARLYRRTLAVLEYDRGRSVTEISRSLRVSRSTVYHWIEPRTRTKNQTP